MRKIIANTFITLDGIMQAPGGPEEDPTSGFDYGGWSVNYWDEMMAKVLMEGLLAKPFDLMLGRKTYDIFAAHWPFVKNDPNKMNAMAADKLNGAKKYVVSKTLLKASWENSTLIKGDRGFSGTTLLMNSACGPSPLLSAKEKGFSVKAQYLQG
jgi:dihydrofolate reductase